MHGMIGTGRQWARLVVLVLIAGAVLASCGGAKGGDAARLGPDGNSGQGGAKEPYAGESNGGADRTNDGTAGEDGAGVAGDSGEGGGGLLGSGETVSEVIGPDGGQIELMNATLIVPSGALGEPTNITVTEVETPTPAGYRAFSPLYRFEPEGLTFSKSLTVSIRSQVSEADVPLGTLFWSRPASEGSGWERRGGVPASGSVVGQVDHFSFGFIADGVDYTETPDRSCVKTRVLDMRTLAPSGVGVFFGMDDCWGRPIVDLEDNDLAVFEDETPLSSEASARLFEQRGLQVFVTLAIDVSSSTKPILSKVVAAAQRFVETLSEPARGLRGRVQVAILGFAGEASAGFVQQHTLDLEKVLTRLGELSTYTPPDASSTNLNGVVVQALNSNAAAQQAFRTRNLGGAFTTGYIALFTDGADASGRVTSANARQQIERSTDDVVAVGLQGADYDPEALRTLLGASQVIDADSDDVLDRDFGYLAARIAGQTRRSYLLGYCSPKRSGAHSVYVGLHDAETRVWGVPPQFEASGFTIGCMPDMFDPTVTCAGKDCGGFGCGACDDRTSACSEQAGSCTSFCRQNDLCSGTIKNPRGYAQDCGADPSYQSCEAECRDTQWNSEYCGSCDTACEDSICVEGACNNVVLSERPQLALGIVQSAGSLAWVELDGSIWTMEGPTSAPAIVRAPSLPRREPIAILRNEVYWVEPSSNDLPSGQLMRGAAGMMPEVVATDVPSSAVFADASHIYYFNKTALIRLDPISGVTKTLRPHDSNTAARRIGVGATRLYYVKQEQTVVNVCGVSGFDGASPQDLGCGTPNGQYYQIREPFAVLSAPNDGWFAFEWFGGNMLRSSGQTLQAWEASGSGTETAASSLAADAEQLYATTVNGLERLRFDLPCINDESCTPRRERLLGAEAARAIGLTESSPLMPGIALGSESIFLIGRKADQTSMLLMIPKSMVGTFVDSPVEPG